MVAAVRAQPQSAMPHAMLEVAPSSAAVPGEDQRYSDAETASSTGAVNSSLSSGSSSLSRLSFDCSPSAALSATPCSPPAPAPAAVRPHRASDAAWAAIRAAQTSAAAPLGPRDFKLVRRIGAGDIGTVYLCRLRTGASSSSTPAGRETGRGSPSPCLFAMKVVDRQAVAKKKKLERAAAEKRILRVLDHPFLPTLFADFDAAPHFTCVVTEFCPGGDLHSLRHRMPSRRFPLPSARFYAAEVLLALEYLHLLGIVYRDLKPENVLIRADGHIMLTDFDLSLESTSSPSLEVHNAAPDAASVSCFPDHLLWFKRRRRNRKTSPSFVAEPVDARSRSFVGTHEYVAPEVARGGPHGAAVDWWAFGVFLYELLHGRTPFAGADNETTLRNIVRRPLAFPPGSCGHGAADDAAARDLVSRLLNKDPAARLGSTRGAAEVKAHPFFRGVNFALLRASRPPAVPGSDSGPPRVRRSQSCKAAPVAASASAKRGSKEDGHLDLFF